MKNPKPYICDQCKEGVGEDAVLGINFKNNGVILIDISPKNIPEYENHVCSRACAVRYINDKINGDNEK